jgi:hypothetical protein
MEMLDPILEDPEEASRIGIHPDPLMANPQDQESRQVTYLSPDLLQNFSDEENDEGITPNEEEGILLLDASMDEELVTPPSQIYEPPSPPITPDEESVVVGDDWIYTPQDLRSHNCDLPILSRAMHEANIAVLKLNSDSVILNKFGISLKQHDVVKLTGPGKNPKIKNGFLNDQIINMYLEMIAHRSTSYSYQREGLPRVTVLPTLLFTVFKEQGFEKVRRWTKRTDIFDCDLSVIPVNMPEHWVLIVIDHGKKLLRLYDSKPDATTRGSRIKIIIDITHYLRLEHLDKKKEEYTAISEYSRTEYSHGPKQENEYDCGTYLCQTAEFLSRNKPLTFSQADMPYLKQKMMWEISAGMLLT